MSERKLATIQVIEKIDPIEGKDRIGLATMVGLGWHVIVNKEDIKVGDKVVYFEIDSILDSTNPAFEFMAKRKFRVKTLKMAGVVSQGLCIPASVFGEENSIVGKDLTDKLKVQKYDPEAVLERSAGKFNDKEKHSKLVKFLLRFKWFRILYYLGKPGVPTFPSEVSKTDECFVGKTLITTDTKRIPIRDIVKNKLHVKVLSYNHNTKTLEYKPVIGWFEKDAEEELLNVRVLTNKHGNRQTSIFCTENHLFYTDRGYIKAKDLKLDDTLYTDDICLSKEGVSIMLGCLLGDSSIKQDRRNAKSDTLKNLSFCQGVKQKEYLDFKIKLFGGDPKDSRENTCDSGWNSNPVFHYCVKSNRDIDSVIEKYCIRNGKKFVSEVWANALTPMSLAFWYMDDGTLTKRESGKIYIRLCTQGFSLEENNNLLKSLYFNFGVFGIVHLDNRCNKYYISLVDSEAKKFLNIIKPYIHESMYYKLDSYENIKKYNYKPVINFDINETTVVNVSKQTDKQRYNNGKKVYDIQVADNENYFVHGILVHNCRLQNKPCVLKMYNGRTINVSEKVDGCSSTFLLKPSKSWFGKKYDYIVCSRNLQVNETGNTVYAEVSRNYDMEGKLTKLLGLAKDTFEDVKFVAIQGEILAPNVQGNKYHKNRPELYVFNIIVGTSKCERLKLGNKYVTWFCDQIGLTTVPMLPDFTINGQSVDDMVELSKFKSSVYDTLAEGKVYRVTDDRGMVIDSFKVINPDFLIKYGD